MTRRQLGVLALVTALSLPLAAAALAIPALRTSSPVGTPVTVLATLFHLLVGLAFWRLVVLEGRAGGHLLLAALACDLVALVPRYVRHLVPSGLTTELLLAASAVSTVATLLFAIGLLRSRLVPAWIPWLSIVPAALSPLSSVLLFLAVGEVGVTPLVGYAQIGLFGLAGLLGFLFWLLLGLNLLRKHEDRDTPLESAPAQHAHPADCGA